MNFLDVSFWWWWICCECCGFQCNGGFAKDFGIGLFWVVAVVVANPRLERMG